MNKKTVPVVFLIFFSLFTCLAPLTVSAQNNESEAKRLLKDARAILAEETEVPKEKAFYEVFKKLEKAIELDPNNYEAHVELAESYRSYSVIYLNTREKRKEAQDYKKRAMNLFKKAISIASYRSEAYLPYLFMLEYEAQKTKDPSVANKLKSEIKAVKEKLYQIDSNNPEVMEMRGYDLIAEGDIKNGSELVLRGINLSKMEPSDMWTGKEKLSHVLKEKGHHKEAEEITAAINMEKNVNAATLEIARSDIKKGLRTLKEALKNDYKNVKEIPDWQQKFLVDVLESKKLYKESADIYRAIDPEKYKVKVKELNEKANQKTR